MGPSQLLNAVQWQIIGMREAGMSLRQIAQRVGHHLSTVSRIVNKHGLTNDFKDRPRSERSRITSRREDNVLGWLVTRNPFVNSTGLKKQWLPHRLLSARTVRNRLKYVGLHLKVVKDRFCIQNKRFKSYQSKQCVEADTLQR
jgi:transposase